MGVSERGLCAVTGRVSAPSLGCLSSFAMACWAWTPPLGLCRLRPGHPGQASGMSAEGEGYGGGGVGRGAEGSWIPSSLNCSCSAKQRPAARCLEARLGTVSGASLRPVAGAPCRPPALAGSCLPLGRSPRVARRAGAQRPPAHAGLPCTPSRVRPVAATVVAVVAGGHDAPVAPHVSSAPGTEPRLPESGEMKFTVRPVCLARSQVPDPSPEPPFPGFVASGSRASSFPLRPNPADPGVLAVPQ